MHFAILGGTRFLGRHVLDALAARGHRVTVFHRGTSEPQGLAQAEHVHGDRATDLDRLADRRFDAVIDTSGYTPDVAGKSVAFFHGRTDRYLFISSVSAYANPDGAGSVDEDSDVATLPEGASATEMRPETYGALKALCELEVRAAFPEGGIIVRPGLIAGPHDPTDRFTYWPLRVRDGGDVLAPDSPDLFVQLIDVRDVAAFCVTLLENRATGTFNATGPRDTVTMGEVLDACKRAANSDARFVWASETFLLEHEVGPWMELPLWIPAGEMRWIVRADTSRALTAGLKIRGLNETVADTLAWARNRSRDELQAGMKSERETELLRELRSS
jgi:2'-hydroxyisoflavone reductase